MRIVQETGKPIGQAACELGVNEGTLGNWCAQDRRHRGESGGPLGEDERAELVLLRRENAELAMQPDVPQTLPHLRDLPPSRRGTDGTSPGDRVDDLTSKEL